MRAMARAELEPEQSGFRGLAGVYSKCLAKAAQEGTAESRRRSEAALGE